MNPILVLGLIDLFILIAFSMAAVAFQSTIRTQKRVIAAQQSELASQLKLIDKKEELVAALNGELTAKNNLIDEQQRSLDLYRARDPNAR